MFEKKIDELYRLTKKVNKSTNADVIFRMGTGSLDIYVRNNKFGINTGFDGNYVLYKSEKLKEETEQQYKLAKEHLERLLQERSNTVCM